MNAIIKTAIATIIVAILGIAIYAGMRGGEDKVTTGSTPNQSQAIATNVVDISDYSYEPQTITIKRGATVTWTNRDRVAHTVTSQSEAPETFTSELFSQGETYEYTFNTSGTYEYFCKPHPYMKATVVVVD